MLLAFRARQVPEKPPNRPLIQPKKDNSMLTIRLSRVGKTKQPTYRLIVSEKSKDPWGKYLENLGTYNPRSTPSLVDFKDERIRYWLGKGAQTSNTVWNLLVDRKVVEGAKKLKVKISKRRKEKMAKKQAA